MMTVDWMHSNASDELSRTRLQGATLALLVQATLIAAAILSLRPALIQSAVQRETTLWLRDLPSIATPPEAIKTIDARPRLPRRATMAPTINPRESSIPALPSGPAASDLQAFGRALFGCAPEHYAELSPEDRAHCTKPGEGLAYQPPDLLGGPSHVKQNARWATALAHKQSPLLLPGGINFPIALLTAVLDGSITDSSSDFRDPGKWPSYVDPGTLMPRDLHDQEREYDAFRKDHPVK
jgi:hypothetical protein